MAKVDDGTLTTGSGEGEPGKEAEDAEAAAGHQAEPKPVVLAPLPEEKPRVSLTIATIPSVAQAYDREGAYLGETELTVAPKKDSGNFTVVLKRDGYHDAIVTLSTKQDSKQVRRLVPLKETRKKKLRSPSPRVERKPRKVRLKEPEAIGTF